MGTRYVHVVDLWSLECTFICNDPITEGGRYWPGSAHRHMFLLPHVMDWRQVADDVQCLWALWGCGEILLVQ